MVCEIMITGQNVKPLGKVEIIVDATITGDGLKQFVVEDVELGSNISGGKVAD
jgi:hypothetical protein